MEQTINIGIGVQAPSKECTDSKCPFHGTLKVRGRAFIAEVTSAKMRRTVSCEFERTYYLPKYQRYERRRTILKAHNPDCIDAKEGDRIKVMECRPLSKTKNFVIVEKVPEHGREEHATA